MSNVFTTWCLLVQLCLALTKFDHKPAQPSCSHSPNFPVCVGKEIFTPQVCEEIINLANQKNAYDIGYDSIDGKPAVQIDVLEKGEIQHPDMYNLISPHLDKLTDFIGEHFSVDFIYWIFFRRYSADGNYGRKSVQFHDDSSGATAILMMNKPDIDFEGGSYQLVGKNITDFDPRTAESRPDGDIYYPKMHQGSALIHDGIIQHGVAPVTKGTRYSLIVFYSVGNIHAVFANDLEMEVMLHFQKANGTDDWTNEFISKILPGQSVQRENAHVKDVFFGIVVNGDGEEQDSVEWKIGFAPAIQNFRCSKSCMLLDKDVFVYEGVQSKLFANDQDGVDHLDQVPVDARVPTPEQGPEQGSEQGPGQGHGDQDPDSVFANDRHKEL